MEIQETAGTMPLTLRKTRIADYAELTKPRLNSMVLLTTLAGFYLASDRLDLALLLHTLGGTALVAAGAAALNQTWEHRTDALMRRTCQRPIPSGRVDVPEASIFGALLVVLGTAWLGLAVNWLTGFLGFITFATYLFLYTPLKTRSVWNTFVGAISGALPPVMGWTSVRNSIGVEAWILFGILFFWQHPHFFALAWRCREDYARGGYRMITTEDPSGQMTGWLMGLTSLALLPVAAGLTLAGVTGIPFMIISVALGSLYLHASYRFMVTPTDAAARRVFLSSLAYLPLLLIAMALNRL